MSDIEGIKKNMEQGKGLTDKKDSFEVVGLDDQDRATSGDFETTRGRGRPANEEHGYRRVGPTPEEEAQQG